MFRAQLILHDKVREVFESSLRQARQSGYLKKRGMRVALDTTYILGRGAVKDTYNLLADGIVKLLRVLATVANIAVGEWAEGQGYERYFGSSIKGEAAIDWSDRKARRKLLGEIVADADRLLELARQAWVELSEDNQHHLEAPFFQHAEQGYPVHPSRLHDHGLHAALRQPLRQTVQVGRESLKLAHRLFGPIGGNCHIVAGGAHVDAPSVQVQLGQLRGQTLPLPCGLSHRFRAPLACSHRISFSIAT